jgi:predicted nucleic acid-binding protein
MPGGKVEKQLALDTNLVLDLAHGADFAHEFREAFQAAGYVRRLPPTAARELHENCINGETAQKRDLARLALLCLRSWGIQPLDLAALEQAVADRFAVRLLEARLLPETEFNDAVILAEAAVAGVPLLVTSDRHLLDIDEDALLLAFNEADLLPVRPVHPKRLLRALR